MARQSYYMLIASLPALPPHFEVDRDPITRPRLDERLKMLEPEDAAMLDRLIDFLAWDRHPADRTDEEMTAHYDELVATVTNRSVRKLIDHRTEIRTIIAGLRRRRDDLAPPVGVDPWASHIRRNWSRLEFGLAARHPWIAPFRQFLDAGDVMEAERLIFSVSWNRWSRAAAHYTFSFEAVILYLARWEIIDRWISRDAARGRDRFEQLVSETLGHHANLID